MFDYASEHTLFRQTRSFSCLDGLRCLSIVAVVWHHTAGTADVGLWAALPGSRFGFLGVDLFFEISGFLIATLLLRERDNKGYVSLSNFYARRALRIFPLYYGIVALLAIYYLTVRQNSSGAERFFDDLPFLLLYLTNWFPASGMLAVSWSLAAEEQFYLVWPAIEKWFARYAVAVLVSAFILSQLIHFGVIDPILAKWFGWTSDEPKMLRETTFTPIILGVALAHVCHGRRTFGILYHFVGWRLAAPAALALLLLICNMLPGDIRGWGRLAIHLAMLLLLAASVLREDNALRPLLSWWPVAKIGLLSYGIYLLHHPGITIAERILGLAGWGHPVLSFIGGMGATTALAALSYRYYETPLLKLKARFT